jgi:HEPN domain-containing protein
MPIRHADWMRQARADLDHAARCVPNGDYCWACFSAQQAAEKAVKAVFLALHAEAWGHGVKGLLDRLPASHGPEGAIIDAARRLDRHYIPARYPNGFPEGAPVDYYGVVDASNAVEDASAVLEFCEGVLRDAGCGGD